MRKLIAHITLVVFLWASVVNPAKAVMPLIGAAAVWFFNQTAATQIAIGGSVALHAAIAAISFTSDSSSPDNTGTNKTLTVQLDPNVPLIAPSSAAATASIPATNGGNVGYCGASCASIKSAIINAYTPQTVGNIAEISGVYWSSTYNIWVVNYKWTLSGGGTTNWHGPSGDVQINWTCPSGYTLSGQTCNVSTAQQSDNKGTIIRTGNSFSTDPNDPDVLPSNVTVSSNKVTVKNPNGRTDEVVIEPNGTLSTYHWEPNSSGDTVQTKVTASAPSAGSPVEVTSVETKTFSGTSSTTGGASGTSSPTSQTQVVGNVNLDKTGLATDGKQCGYDAAHPCKVEIDTTGLGTNAVSQDDYSAKALAHQTQLEAVGAGGDHGFTWEWNPLSTLSTGSCTDPTFVIGGKNYIDLTGFCDKVAYLRGFFEFMLYISTGIALFNILTGRREEV